MFADKIKSLFGKDYKAVRALIQENHYRYNDLYKDGAHLMIIDNPDTENEVAQLWFSRGRKVEAIDFFSD